jgi:bifunctional non-homologous end joining protein LigD
VPAARRAIEPMLAGTASEIPAGTDWTFEPKYDGMRVVAYVTRDDVRLVTRNGIDRAPQFPEIVHALRELARRQRRTFVLDGEIIVRRRTTNGASPFQALQARWHVSDMAAVARHANRTPVDLVAFDILVDGEERVMNQPWTSRRVRLERLLRTSHVLGVRLAETAKGDGAGMLQRAVKRGWEGIIAKRVDAPYKPGIRTRDWLKLKVVNEQEFVVGGWTEPRRSREHLGALLLGYWKDGELVYAGHTGTGFTRDTLRDLDRRLTRIERQTSPFVVAPRTNQRAHWTQPSVVVVVRFTEWTADGKLRHPVFLGVRDDKNAADVGREPRSMQKRVARMAKTMAEASSAGRKTKHSVTEQLERLENGDSTGTIVTGARTKLDVTNLGKVYFPKARLTKGHVMRYYAALAPVILPVVKDRPLVLKRYPNGIKREGGAFFQQSAPEHSPDGVRVEKVRTADGMEPRIVGGDLTTLLYGVQIGAIELNPWHSRVGSLKCPDYAILDLDPGPESSFALVVQTARWIRECMDELNLTGSVKTSGGRGMHVYLPLPARTSYATARVAADLIAHHVNAAHPTDTTLIRPLKQRPPNAVYIDVGQNDYGKSVAAAFSLRAREPGPVSTPLEWDELVDSLDPTTFTIDSVLPDAKRRAEIWRQGLRRPVRLERLTRKRRGSTGRAHAKRSA